MASQRDCGERTGRAASIAARRETPKWPRRGGGARTLAVTPLTSISRDAAVGSLTTRSLPVTLRVISRTPVSFTLTFSVLFPMNEVMGIIVTTAESLAAAISAAIESGAADSDSGAAHVSASSAFILQSPMPLHLRLPIRSPWA
jgi:hypothetical protein